MGVKVPENFEWNGWSKANGYLMGECGITEKGPFYRERFRRSSAVCRAYFQTEEGKLARKTEWEERAIRAKQQSDTTEVLLLEKITQGERDGHSTAELVAGCINLIARALAKKGVANVDELSTKELIQVGNFLLGLTKAASAAKKETNWQPQVQVNNVTVNTSKTGGVVGGLQDVIDLSTQKTPHTIEAEVSRV